MTLENKDLKTQDQKLKDQIATSTQNPYTKLIDELKRLPSIRAQVGASVWHFTSCALRMPIWSD
jgi:hypothetical protein